MTANPRDSFGICASRCARGQESVHRFKFEKFQESNRTVRALSAEAPEGGRNEDSADGQRKQTGGSLSDSRIEVLFQALQTAKEEAHSKYQEQI